MQMQISAASSRRTSATVLRARPRLKKVIDSDIHILKSARCVFLPSMLATAVNIQGTGAIVGGTTRARREAGI